MTPNINDIDFDEVRTLHIVFDGPPGPEAGRFIEVETPDGKSVSAGKWVKRADGYWALILEVAS